MSRKTREQKRAVNRRAKTYGALGKHTFADWMWLKLKYNYRCLKCLKMESGLELETRLTIDHVVPLSRGGTNDIGNIQPLCGKCNVRKDKRIIDYRDTFEDRVAELYVDKI